MRTLKIHSLSFDGSVADGPGIRSLIFFQGCKAHCPGCHNPETWEIDKGIIYSVDELVDEIITKSMTKRITISGGEPLLQKDSLIDLLHKLKVCNFDIALYTGFDLKDIPQEILVSIDYVKTGLFVLEKKSSLLQYVGSENQSFIATSDLNLHQYKGS